MECPRIAKILNLLCNGNIPKLSIQKLKNLLLPVQSVPNKFEQKAKDLFHTWSKMQKKTFSQFLDEIIEKELEERDSVKNCLDHLVEINLGVTPSIKQSNLSVLGENTYLIRSKNLLVDN